MTRANLTCSINILWTFPEDQWFLFIVYVHVSLCEEAQVLEYSELSIYFFKLSYYPL